MPPSLVLCVCYQHFKLGDDQSDYVAELQNTFDPAFTRLFASHALAPALGLTDAGVDAYMSAFLARSLGTATAAPSREWNEGLDDTLLE